MATEIILPDEPRPVQQPGLAPGATHPNGVASGAPRRGWPVFPPMPAYRAGTNTDRPDLAKGDREPGAPAPDARQAPQPFKALRGGVR